jgi:hypothetical protein
MSRSVLAVVGLLIMGALGLAGCTRNEPAQTPQPANPAAVLAWDKSADAVIFRLDRQVLNEPDFQARNRLPYCTLYGDGRVVWVNTVQLGGEEVLEALIDDTQFRAFLEFLIRDQRFYDIPDYASLELPPTQNAGVDSITLTLGEQVRTVRNYRQWPTATYALMLERCVTLSDSPVRVAPSAGWVTVYEGPPQTQLPRIDWPATAPFTIAQAAQDRQSLWVEGPAFRQLWNTQRDTMGNVVWHEGGKNYRVAVQVPGISRDALPPPATPTPSP